MQSVSYHIYELKGPLFSRTGALLRFEFDTGFGYADCHPWDIFGDAPLEKQLSNLSHGLFTKITSRSYFFAKLDASARLENRHLFEGKNIPKNHFLWTGGEVPEGFCTVKIKVRERVPKIEGKKLRLDCNERFTPETVDAFFSTLDPQQVEFVEDPTPYDEKLWNHLYRKYGIPLARDAGSENKGACQVLVVKPAAQEMLEDGRKIVVTSYLDHPIGQLAAALFAPDDTIHGLASHLAYEKNAFSECFDASPYLKPPPGTGLGFDEQLKKTAWKKLTSMISDPISC